MSVGGLCAATVTGIRRGADGASAPMLLLRSRLGANCNRTFARAEMRRGFARRRLPRRDSRPTPASSSRLTGGQRSRRVVAVLRLWGPRRARYGQRHQLPGTSPAACRLKLEDGPPSRSWTRSRGGPPRSEAARAIGLTPASTPASTARRVLRTEASRWSGNGAAVTGPDVTASPPADLAAGHVRTSPNSSSSVSSKSRSAAVCPPGSVRARRRRYGCRPRSLSGHGAARASLPCADCKERPWMKAGRRAG